MRDDLPHLNARGEAHIVDIGAKDSSERMARAEGYIEMRPATLAALRAGDLKKGDALGCARIAGIMAAKRTAELIPLCHPIPLSHVGVELELLDERPGVRVSATARTTGQTGVEMEALTAVQVALLTLYDMCKALDRGMRMTDVQLLEKQGGRSGHWTR